MLLRLRSIAKYRTCRDSLECNPDDDVMEFLPMGFIAEVLKGNSYVVLLFRGYVFIEQPSVIPHSDLPVVF